MGHKTVSALEKLFGFRILDCKGNAVSCFGLQCLGPSCHGDPRSRGWLWQIIYALVGHLANSAGDGIEFEAVVCNDIHADDISGTVLGYKERRSALDAGNLEIDGRRKTDFHVVPGRAIGFEAGPLYLYSMWCFALEASQSVHCHDGDAG